ncbi:MAG: PsbP-related protein [Dehalococcoidia bacterium]|jgi:hypothetical protein
MILARIAVIALLGMTLVSIVACGSDSEQGPTPTPVFTTYTNSSEGFSISIPITWETLSMGDVGVFFSSDTTCSGRPAVASVAPGAPNTSLQTSYERIKTGLEAQEGFDIISEEEITIDGIPAWKCIFTAANLLEGHAIQTEFCVLVQENTSWLISFMCVPECWDTYEDIFDTMLNSFQVLG